MEFMNTKHQTFNIITWFASISLLIFSLINQKYMFYNHIFLQFIVTLVALGSSIFLFINTNQGSAFYKYWLSAVAELKKVTWPSMQEARKATLAVIVMVVVTGLMLWTVDSILIRLVSWLLQRRW